MHLEHVALDRGFAYVQLEVNKTNPRAQRLYERLGYHLCGENIGHWSYIDGDRVVEVIDDNYVMCKALQPYTV